MTKAATKRGCFVYDTAALSPGRHYVEQHHAVVKAQKKKSIT